MWTRFLFLAIATFAVLCSAYEDRYSCDFDGRWCNWFPKNISGNCNWKLSNETFKGKKGYAVLNGANGCVAQLRWMFLWFPINLKMISFEYYVTGPGPYSLGVTSEKSYKLEWICNIQPGDQKREGHAAPIRQSNILIINANVAAGSQLIIPQVWKGLQGHKAEHICPKPHPGNVTIPPNHRVSNTTRHVPVISSEKTVTKNMLVSTTESPSSSSSSSSIFMQYLISLKGKLVGLIRNITLSVKVDYDENKKNRSNLFSFNQEK